MRKNRDVRKMGEGRYGKKGGRRDIKTQINSVSYRPKRVSFVQGEEGMRKAHIFSFYRGRPR